MIENFALKNKKLTRLSRVEGMVVAREEEEVLMNDGVEETLQDYFPQIIGVTDSIRRPQV